MPVIARVDSRELITPDMVRLKCTVGPGEFDPSEYTDAYVKLVLPHPETQLESPVDETAARETLPREHWPLRRTYTVRAYEPATRCLTIDFVTHGDEGVAGPWSRDVALGSEVTLLGPGGGYSPRADAPWHLLVGDESALPAIAATLERLCGPEFSGVKVAAVLNVANIREQQELIIPDAATVTWVLREADPASAVSQVLAAVRALDYSSLPHAFIHGEAAMVREVRRYLRGEHALPLEWLSASGYWRQGVTDEGWRAAKKEWNAAVLEAEADLPQ